MALLEGEMITLAELRQFLGDVKRRPRFLATQIPAAQAPATQIIEGFYVAGICPDVKTDWARIQLYRPESGENRILLWHPSPATATASKPPGTSHFAVLIRIAPPQAEAHN